MKLNFQPIGKEEIHKLETALLIGSLFRPEVMEEIRNSSERLTWVDSLAVAAGALARNKAGMSTSEIAEELGRTEQTIREHLKGDTKAGKIVAETYDMLKSGKLDLNKMLTDTGPIKEKLENVKKEIEEIIEML
jgi:probable regulatory domain-containing protein